MAPSPGLADRPEDPTGSRLAAMRKLLVLCFGVLKTGKLFDSAIAMGC
jgi:hypothetical protein